MVPLQAVKTAITVEQIVYDNLDDQAHWGYWGEYSECSEECGGGEQTRTRDCMRPRYSGYGNG